MVRVLGATVRQETTRIWRMMAFATAVMAYGNPARAATTQIAVITASVSKPLALEWVQDLDLGAIAPTPGSWSGAKIGISRNGVFTCANVNVTCSGSTKVAQYTVTGSNKDVVRINAPNVTLVNQADPTSTLLLTVDSPSTVTLTNSGNPGTTFSLGGSIVLTSDTPGGLYSGTMNVTVDF